MINKASFEIKLQYQKVYFLFDIKLQYTHNIYIHISIKYKWSATFLYLNNKLLIKSLPIPLNGNNIR